MLRRKFLTAALVAAVAALSAPSKAEAAFTITVQVGANAAYTVNETSLGVIGNTVLTGAQFGDYTITISGNTAVGVNGSNQTYSLTHNTIDVTTTAATAQQIKITALDDDVNVGFFGPIINGAVKTGITTLNSPGSTVTVDVSGSVNGSSAAIATQNGSGFVQTALAANLTSASYDVSNTIVINGLAGILNPNFGQPGQPQYFAAHANLGAETYLESKDTGGGGNGGDLEPVPAPAGLALIATAAPFFGLLRRRMKTVATA